MRLTTGNGQIIERRNTVVQVNGRTRTDVECLGIERTMGVRGNQALLYLPAARAADRSIIFQDAEVVVFETGNSSPIFRGYVRPRNDAENANNSNSMATASSILALMDRVTVGQQLGRRVVDYPQLDPITLLSNGWTISRIFQDLFAPGRLPAEWANRVRLGNLSAVVQAQASVATPDVRFTTTGYQSAIAKLLSLVPNVSIRERYTATQTILDFYLIGDDSEGVRTIRIPTETSGPTAGAVVTSWRTSVDSSGTYSRGIGYGRGFETQITLSTTFANPAARIEGAWIGATSYDPTPDPPPAPTAAEALVLNDPRRAQPNSPVADPALLDVFRRFKLPGWLKAQTINGRNVARTSTGERIPIQLITEEIRLIVDGTEEDGSKRIVQAVNMEEPELMQGWQLTPDGEIILAEPAVYVSAVWLDPGGVVRVERRRRELYITLTLAETTGRALRYDTGVNGDIRFPGLTSAGMVFEFTNENLGFERLGSNVDEFADENGNPVGFPSIHYDPETENWAIVDEGLPVVIQNDFPILQSLAESALRERNRRRTDASVALPYASAGFDVGDSIRLVGRETAKNKRFQIVQVIVDYENQNTILALSDSIPQTINTSGLENIAAMASMAARRAEELRGIGEEIGGLTNMDPTTMPQGNRELTPRQQADRQPVLDMGNTEGGFMLGRYIGPS